MILRLPRQATGAAVQKLPGAAPGAVAVHPCRGRAGGNGAAFCGGSRRWHLNALYCADGRAPRFAARHPAGKSRTPLAFPVLRGHIPDADPDLRDTGGFVGGHIRQGDAGFARRWSEGRLPGILRALLRALIVISAFVVGSQVPKLSGYSVLGSPLRNILLVLPPYLSVLLLFVTARAKTARLLCTICSAGRASL